MLNNRHFAVAAEGLDQSLRCQFAAPEIVSRNVGFNSYPRHQCGNIGSEDGDSRFVCLRDRSADRFRIARRKHDSIDMADNKIRDLVALFRGIELSRAKQYFHSVLGPFVLHGIAELAKKRIGHGEQRHPHNQPLRLSGNCSGAKTSQTKKEKKSRIQQASYSMHNYNFEVSVVGPDLKLGMGVSGYGI